MTVMTRAQWIGGSHWLWGIVMFTLTYEMLHQLTALPLGDGGIWPENFAPALKDWYHSRTMGQFRFVKARDAAPRCSAEMQRRDRREIGSRFRISRDQVVAAIEMMAMLFGTGIILPWALGQTPIATAMCDC